MDAGVTTARDLGDRNGLALRLAAEIAEGSARGPRIVSASAPITPPGGHCWFLGGEASGADEIRRQVRRNAAAGARVIKVMVSGGGLTPGGPRPWETQFSTAELEVVVEVARAAGLPVAAHAHGTEGIIAAVNAGVDTIEHCTWMSEDGTIKVRDDVLTTIIDRGIRVCPTVSPHWRMLPQLFGAERAEAMIAGIRYMAEAGVRLIAGTDAGVQRSGFDGLVSSLGFYDHLGLSADRVIAMATAEAADALGLGGHTGRLAPGYSADLLVVDGDPLDDLGRLGDVRTVVAAGRHHHPAQS
ncbi:amidohydrolase family protein [Streptomyces jumonjinensis]|uniref:amidohydrolase family protein n=1 Tax=Streptomyces jumonjinensis TaxID=1945 RepID=UPI002B1F14B9|nr:amidohydrolase family protein [Streptomyces jumonjinensis]